MKKEQTKLDDTAQFIHFKRLPAKRMIQNEFMEDGRNARKKKEAQEKKKLRQVAKKKIEGELVSTLNWYVNQTGRKLHAPDKNSKVYENVVKTMGSQNARSFSNNKMKVYDLDDDFEGRDKPNKEINEYFNFAKYNISTLQQKASDNERLLLARELRNYYADANDKEGKNDEAEKKKSSVAILQRHTSQNWMTDSQKADETNISTITYTEKNASGQRANTSFVAKRSQKNYNLQHSNYNKGFMKQHPSQENGETQVQSGEYAPGSNGKVVP